MPVVRPHHTEPRLCDRQDGRQQKSESAGLSILMQAAIPNPLTAYVEAAYNILHNG